MKIGFSCSNPSIDPPISGFLGGDPLPTVAGIRSDGFQAGSARLGGLVGFRVWLDTPKYFHEEETMTLATLQATKQRNGEDLMEYIKRFRDIVLECYDHCEERTLIEMCMTNMIQEFRAVLENLKISQFAQLLQKARKTA